MAFQLIRRARDRDADGAGVSWVRFSLGVPHRPGPPANGGELSGPPRSAGRPARAPPAV